MGSIVDIKQEILRYKVCTRCRGSTVEDVDSCQRAECDGVFRTYESLLEEYGVVGELRERLDALLDIFKPSLPKVFLRGIVDFQRDFSVPARFYAFYLDFLRDAGLGAPRRNPLPKKKPLSPPPPPPPEKVVERVTLNLGPEGVERVETRLEGDEARAVVGVVAEALTTVTDVPSSEHPATVTSRVFKGDLFTELRFARAAEGAEDEFSCFFRTVGNKTVNVGDVARDMEQDVSHVESLIEKYSKNPWRQFSKISYDAVSGEIVCQLSEVRKSSAITMELARGGS